MLIGIFHFDGRALLNVLYHFFRAFLRRVYILEMSFGQFFTQPFLKITCPKISQG
jgi:hypothetical protein